MWGPGRPRSLRTQPRAPASWCRAPGVGRPPPTPFPGWLRLGTAGQPAAARIVPGTELSIRRILSGRVEVELFECGRLCCALGNTGRAVTPLPRPRRDCSAVCSWHSLSGWQCVGLPAAARRTRARRAMGTAYNRTLSPTSPNPSHFFIDSAEILELLIKESGQMLPTPLSLTHPYFSFSRLGCLPQTPPFHPAPRVSPLLQNPGRLLPPPFRAPSLGLS